MFLCHSPSYSVKGMLSLFCTTQRVTMPCHELNRQSLEMHQLNKITETIHTNRRS